MRAEGKKALEFLSNPAKGFSSSERKETRRQRERERRDPIHGHDTERGVRIHHKGEEEISHFMCTSHYKIVRSRFSNALLLFPIASKTRKLQGSKSVCELSLQFNIWMRGKKDPSLCARRNKIGNSRLCTKPRGGRITNQNDKKRVCVCACAPLRF